MLFPAVAAATSGATAAALAGSAGSPAAVHAADVARPGMVAGLATGRGPPAPPGPVGPASLAPAGSGGGAVLLASAPASTPSAARQIARAMLPRFHWSAAKQFTYLNRLWNRESGWNRYASNPYSGAYGIPQAVPGSKMASAGPNWRSNPATQIRWGLRYIRGRYGSPHRAWNHELAYGWY